MSFSSKDTKLSDILQQIDEGIIQLPDFQRGWVWDDLHLRGLIASLSNSYPIGALMFLDNSNPISVKIIISKAFAQNQFNLR